MRRGRTERSVHGTMSRTAGPSGFARRANRPEKVPLAKTPCGWLHLVSGTAAPGIGAGATRLAVWRELCSGGHQPATLYRRASRRLLRYGRPEPHTETASGAPALHPAANSSWGTWAALAGVGSSSNPP